MLPRAAAGGAAEGGAAAEGCCWRRSELLPRAAEIEEAAGCHRYGRVTAWLAQHLVSDGAPTFFLSSLTACPSCPSSASLSLLPPPQSP